MSEEKPIIFSTEEVRAIPDGRKTMTRRVVKKKYSNTNIEKRGDILIEIQNDTPPDVYNPETEMITHHLKMCVPIKIPYRIGQILWARETWADLRGMGFDKQFSYLSDCVNKNGEEDGEGKRCRLDYGVKWRPSTNMPHTAARLFLKVKSVRVERLQDITEQDILSEGTPFDREIYEMPCNIQNAGATYLAGCFMRFWDSINSKRGYGWDSNPWVWVVEFERVEV